MENKEKKNKADVTEELAKHIPEMINCGKFAIGKFPVTFAQYDYYCKTVGKDEPNDEGWGRGESPVININWYEASDYCQWLSKITNRNFRLPSLNEWKYAARGGENSKEYKYSGSNNLDEVGWYSENSGNKTQPVGLKKPNELGIYDMSGNVSEWCLEGTDYPLGAVKHFKGGSYEYFAVYCGVNELHGDDPYRRMKSVGMRIVEEL